jgi:hypothetical protein
MYEKRQSCGAAIRLPGLPEGAGWRRGRRRETYDLAEGVFPVLRPRSALLVKPSQAWSNLVKAKTGV